MAFSPFGRKALILTLKYDILERKEKCCYMFQKRYENKRQEMISIVNNILSINVSLILFES